MKIQKIRDIMEKPLKKGDNLSIIYAPTQQNKPEQKEVFLSPEEKIDKKRDDIFRQIFG